MWFLLAAIIGSSSLVILLKTFELKGVHLYAGITVNYIVAAVLSLIFSPISLAISSLTSQPWIAISLVIGILFMLSFVVYAISAQRSGVAITTISGRAAVVIPVGFAFAFFGEEITTLKILMLLLIIISMGLILHKPKKENSFNRNDLLVFILPAAVFLFNGINDTLVQYAQREKIDSEDLIPLFTAVMFAAGAFAGLFCYGVSNLRRRHKFTIRDLGWGSLLGLMNWICMTGVFRGLDYMDGSVFYPLYYTGAIVIATMFGIWVFGEKLTRLNYAGICIAVVAIAVLSIQG